MRLAKIILALLLVPSLAPGQAGFGEKVTVNYVEIPVTVIAKDGTAVRGLTRESFRILDDGKVRPIESFDVIDFAAERQADAVSPLNPASRRYFLLLFDLSFSSPTSVARAQEAAREFIARGLGNHDLVAVARMDVERGFRFLTSFTTDRELLTAAVANPLTFRSLDPLQIGSGSPVMTTERGGASAGPGGGRGETASPAAEMAADFARANAKIDEGRNRARVKKEVETLAAVARTLQQIAGRKHLVLLSEGFDPRLVQGRGAGESKEELEENLAVQFGEVWKVDSDKRFGSPEAQQSITRMADEFRRADVVLHAVDIQGVRVQNDVRGGAKVNSNEGLFLLAKPTGGTVFRNSNEIGSDFDRLSRQHEVVYVLGFQAPAGKAGQYHPIEVQISGAPGARVQHRGGYYDPGDESPVARSLTMAEVIVNDIPQDAIGMHPLVAAFPADGGQGLVPVVLEIDGADVVKQAKDGVVTADVFVYAFDPSGVVRGSLNQRVRIDAAKAGDRLRSSGIRYYGALKLPPGRYAVKALVRTAESDAKGFARVDVDVPARGEVALVRPLFFAEPGDWVMVRSPENANAPYPFVMDGESFIPAARVVLPAGEPRVFALFVYNAGADEVEFDITPAAKPVSTTVADGGLTRYLFALEKVPAGTRELRVVMRKRGSTDQRVVTVALSAD